MVTNSSSGTITTKDSHAIIAGGTGVEVTNNGEITVNGNNNSYGILGGTGGEITNGTSGTITTLGSDSHAIQSNGASSAITNSGIITTVGANSDGLNLTGSGTEITNSGTITVLGTNAIAVSLGDATFTNNGTLVANGNATEAITAGTGTQTVTLGATSVTTGTINLGAGNDTLAIANGATVNGAIDLGSGNDTLSIVNGVTINSAIDLGAGDDTLTIANGATINSAIDLGAGTDTVTYDHAGISSRIAASNVENVNFNTGVVGVITSDSIHTVDPTSVASLTIAASNLSKTINGTVNSRVSDNQEGGEEGKVWTKIFGSEFERGTDTDNLAYDHDYNGVVVGYDYGDNSGFMIGVSNGEITTKSQSFSSDVNSAFLGYYNGFKLLDDTFINSNILAGYEQYKNERVVSDNINGNQTAISDVNNTFISPSIELEHRIKILDSLEVRPDASVNYTASFFSSADETGTTASNIKTQSRDVTILNTRLGLTTILTLFNNYKFHVGLGIDSREIDEDNVESTISSTSFSFSTNNQESVSGDYINFGFNVVNIDNLIFGLNAEIRSADGDEKQKTANLNLGYRF